MPAPSSNSTEWLKANPNLGPASSLSPLAAALLALEQSETQLVAQREKLDRELAAAEALVRASTSQRADVDAQLAGARDAIARLRKTSGIRVVSAKAPRQAQTSDRGRKAVQPPPIAEDALLTFLKASPASPASLLKRFKVSRYELAKALAPLLKRRAVVAIGATIDRRFALPDAAKEAGR